MIMHKLKIISFICIVLVTLQTGHSIQENCAKYDGRFSCRMNNVRFFLKTGFAHQFLELYLDSPFTIYQAVFKKEDKIKFIFHGFGGSHTSIEVEPLQEEYHRLGYKVLMINYHELAKTGCYRTAIENSLMISACAARMTEAIILHTQVQFVDFHLLGYSLGGQLVGQVPHLLNKSIVGNIKFSRITGIDPAREGFFEEYSADKYTLTKSDADLVDVLHSNSGFSAEFGPMGYVDWYPNFGIFQPGCNFGDNTCNHMRSLILFYESIGDPNFQIQAERCPDLETKFLRLQPPCQKINAIHFGEHFFKDGENGGIYFFGTSGLAPYIRRHAFIRGLLIYQMHLQTDRFTPEQ